MKDFLAIALKYLPPYKWMIAANFVFNILSAIFGVFSLLLAVPMLEIILQDDGPVYEDRKSVV